MLAPLEFVDRYSIRENRSLLKVCEPLFQAFDVNFLYYNSVSPDGELVSIGTHKEWMNHYYSDCLWKDNPFFTAPHLFRNGIFVYRLSHSPNLERTYDVARDKYGLNLALVFVNSAPDRCVQFGVSVRTTTQEAELKLLNEKALLEKFFGYFQTELSRLITKAQENPIDIKSIRGPQFETTSPVLQGGLELEMRAKFLKSIGTLNEQVLQTRLSAREIECARSLFYGMTAKQIAEQLAISHRTVEFYIGNIRNKLGVFTKDDLREVLASMRALDLI